MKRMRRFTFAWIGILLSTLLQAQSLEVPETVSLAEVGSKPNPFAQTVVEALRSEMGTEIGWLGAAFFTQASFPKGSYQVETLLKGLLYPDDEVVVLSLKGSQIREALERAIELYPQKNNAFLQIAGMKVVFNPSATGHARIVSVKVGKEPLVPDRLYTVATTAPLARGALGYFRVWDKSQITKSSGRTVAEVFRAYLGRQPAWISEPAWVVQRQ